MLLVVSRHPEQKIFLQEKIRKGLLENENCSEGRNENSFDAIPFFRVAMRSPPHLLSHHPHKPAQEKFEAHHTVISHQMNDSPAAKAEKDEPPCEPTPPPADPPGGTILATSNSHKKSSAKKKKKKSKHAGGSQAPASFGGAEEDASPSSSTAHQGSSSKKKKEKKAKPKGASEVGSPKKNKKRSKKHDGVSQPPPAFNPAFQGAEEHNLESGLGSIKPALSFTRRTPEELENDLDNVLNWVRGMSAPAQEGSARKKKKKKKKKKAKQARIAQAPASVQETEEHTLESGGGGCTQSLPTPPQTQGAGEDGPVDHAEIPFATAEAHMNEERPWLANKWNVALLKLLGLVVAVLVGLLLSFATGVNEGEEEPKTRTPTSADFAEMLAFAQTKSSSSSLADPYSPQYKAVEWLAYDKVNSENNWSDNELLQRYVLRVLFHSTDGDNLDAYTLWFKSSSVCDWGSLRAQCNGNGQQVDLIELELGDLYGTIPVELALLTALTYLDLARNVLFGTLPTELGQLTALTVLALSDNQLTGTIPAELGQLIALTDLGLGSNVLFGNIPTQLGQLTALTWLNLSKDKLTGTIPLALTQLTNLKRLYLQGNRLTGQMPPGFCSAPFPDWRADGWYGTNRLVADCIPEIQCDCCDRCYDESGKGLCWSYERNNFGSCI